VCELRLGERMIVNLFCPHNSPGIIFRLAGRRTERSGVRERKKKKDSLSCLLFVMDYLFATCSRDPPRTGL